MTIFEQILWFLAKDGVILKAKIAVLKLLIKQKPNKANKLLLFYLHYAV